MGNRGTQIQMSVPPLTPAIKWILIICVGMWFFFQIILDNLMGFSITQYLALIPHQALFDFYFWQPLTYMFLHSTKEVSHIIFNMLMLWFLGAELEQKWGTRSFLMFYLVNGFCAGLIYIFGTAIYALITGSQGGLIIPVVGASGALFAVMMAYARFFGDRLIYFFMIFPMKARYFVMILAFIQLVSMMTSSARGEEVAYLAHLGGLASGFLYLVAWQWWLKRQWNKKSKRKTHGLKLVVNNDKNDDGDSTKYWN